jgi:hypothetical protein
VIGVMLSLLSQATAPAPAAAPNVSEMVEYFLGPERVSNRLDCVTHSRRVLESGLTAWRDKMDYVFIFPLRPELQTEEVRSRVRFVRSMDDGRSWIVEGRIVDKEWARWPNFSARIAEGAGVINLKSDPEREGIVTLSGYSPASHGPGFEQQGECRFVPETPHREAVAR